MSLNLNGKPSCKIYFNGKEMCVGYINGVKAFGCREEATVSDNTGILSTKTFTFGEGSFTKNFTTDSPYTYNNVYIDSLPGIESLDLLGVGASIGSKFKAINSSSLKFRLADRYAIYGGVVYDFQESIDGIIARYESLSYKLTENSAGTLTFTNLDDQTDIVKVQGTKVDNTKLKFKFKVTDSSPLEVLTNTATFTLVPQGDVNVKTIYVNNPPTVGDNTITMKRSDIRTFYRTDFIDDTDPRFSDPEGDQPYKLRVDELPTDGTLTLRGVPVTIGQEIDFVVDIDAGAFKYTPDITKSVSGVFFRFSVSDTGSKQFG